MIDGPTRFFPQGESVQFLRKARTLGDRQALMLGVVFEQIGYRANRQALRNAVAELQRKNVIVRGGYRLTMSTEDGLPIFDVEAAESA